MRPGFLNTHLSRQYAKLYKKDTFIAVTGSVGKTLCAKAINAVLSKRYKTISTDTNSDSTVNIPAAILKLRPNIKKAIFELNIEQPGDLDFYLSLIKPKTVVVTRISYVHNEFFGNLDQIIEEKGKLIECLSEDGLAILNWDDVSSKKLAAKCKGNVVYFGNDESNCLIWASNIRIENFKTVFELNLGVERVQINLPLLGRHQVFSVLAAATIGVLEKMPLTTIKIALESLQPLEHQLQLVAGPNGSIILDDSLDASPVAVEAAIDTLMQIPARRRVLVLGEMKGLGGFSDSLHRQVAQKIFKEKIDLVFLGQGQANIIAEELNNLGFWEERVLANLQNSQLVSKLLSTLDKGDVCLIKGSKTTRLDEIIKRIAKK